MDKKTKADWVKALRNGKYVQARGRLRVGAKTTPDRFCCLGVLCDITIPGSWHQGRNGWAHDGSVDLIALNIREDLGLGNSDQMTLADMNDTQKMSFTEIADWIEENI